MVDNALPLAFDGPTVDVLALASHGPADALPLSSDGSDVISLVVGAASSTADMLPLVPIDAPPSTHCHSPPTAPTVDALSLASGGPADALFVSSDIISLFL